MPRHTRTYLPHPIAPSPPSTKRHFPAAAAAGTAGDTSDDTAPPAAAVDTEAPHVPLLSPPPHPRRNQSALFPLPISSLLRHSGQDSSFKNEVFKYNGEKITRCFSRARHKSSCSPSGTGTRHWEREFLAPVTVGPSAFIDRQGS